MYDNLNVLGTLTVAGNVQTGGATSSNMTFIGTTQVDTLNALTRISTNTIQARNTSHLLVDDKLTVNGDLVVQGSNIQTAIDGISTQLALKAPSASPTFTGTLNADSINITSGGLGKLALSTTGRVSVGSNVQTPVLMIPGSNATDNLTVQNSLGSIVARFQNDYSC